MERALLDDSVYCLYGMYTVVLAACMVASRGDPEQPRDSLFPDQPRPRPHNPFPWEDFVCPLPGDMVRNQLCLRPGAPLGWRWPQTFVQDVDLWARVLAWGPGLANVSWAELALDYEAFVGRALPASPDHHLRRTRLPLGERARVIRKARGLVERHLVAGPLLLGAPLRRCRHLLPFGGRVCAGLSTRLFFAAHHEVMLQLVRVASHCRDTWVRRLRTPARISPSLSDRFLMDYYPRPPAAPAVR